MPTTTTRTRALAALLLFGGGAALLIPALAHDGHAPPAAGGFDPDAPRKVAAATAAQIGLSTAEVDFGTIEDVVETTGSVALHPTATVAVTARYRSVVVGVKAGAGEVVAAGAAVVEIDPVGLGEKRAELLQLEAQGAESRGKAAVAVSAVARLRTQAEAARAQAALLTEEERALEAAGDAVARSVLMAKRQQRLALDAEAASKSAEAESAVVEARAAAAHADALDRAAGALRGVLGEDAGPGASRVMAAPRAGVLSAVNVVPGEVVEAGTVVAMVADPAVMRVEAEVPVTALSRLGLLAGGEARPGAGAARVMLPGGGAGGVVDGSALAGRVVAVAPKADGVARTARVLIDVAPAPGTPQWPEGLPVRVVLVAATKADAVVVPRSAVLFEGPRAVVFVKDKDAFKKVDVHLGARDDRHFEVKEGLVPGDVVVVSGVYALAQTRPAGAPAAPAADGHGHKH